MVVKYNAFGLHIEFEVDGTEESTLDWEKANYSLRGYKDNKDEEITKNFAGI